MASATCPHCKRVYSTIGYDKHLVRCPYRDELRSAIIDAMTGEDGYAVPRDVYEQRAIDDNLPSPSTMRAMFGTWAAALAHFGVSMRPSNATECTAVQLVAPKDVQPGARAKCTRRPHRSAEEIDAEIGAEIEATMHVTRQALAAARYETDHGYTVAVRRSDGTPYVRTLPGGGVACMLR